MKRRYHVTGNNTVSASARNCLTALAVLALAQEPALAAGQFICCHDTSGKQICGDILPPSCYGRAYREVGSNGQTIRSIEAPLTAEQRAQRATEEEKLRVEEDKRKEQYRKDQALLNTYGSERDIDAMRLRAETDIFQSIRNSETKITEIRQRRQSFENEAEFYKKKTLPMEVKKGLTDADIEIRAQESSIESKKKELETVRARYDDDKRRYKELSRRPPR